MIAGKPTIVISYSERYRDSLAGPLAEHLEAQGIKAVLIGDEPLPSTIDSTPTDKVAWFFQHANMAVFLATPDDELVSGEIHTRQNIIDEHRLGHELPHLHHRLLVFKADGVTFPSNINPVYERLPLDDPQWVARRVTEQAVVWQLLPTDREETAGRPIDSSGENPGGGSAPEIDADAGASEQALGAILHASAALQGDAPDTPLLWRAQLAIAGLAASEGSADTIAVHLANRLFRQRDDIVLRPSERLVLLRTYLRHAGDDNVPVFAWLCGLGRDEVVGLLESVATSDSEPQIQAQAIRLLTGLRPMASAGHVRGVIAPLLQHDNSSVRGASIDLIAARGDRALRDLLDDVQLAEQDGQKVARATALIDVRRYPGRVFERYMSESAVRTEEVQGELLARADRLSKSAVEASLHNPSSEVRRFGIAMCRARGGMPTELAYELIARDNSPNVRLDALQALLDQDAGVSESILANATKRRDDDDKSGPSSFDQSEVAELAFWMRQPLDVVEERLEWASVQGAWCYEALGVKDSRWAQRHVRRDIREDFRRLRELSRERLYQRFKAASDVDGVTLAVVDERFEKAWSEWAAEGKLRNFILRRLQRAAIRCLTVHGTKRDLPIIREFADSGHSELRPDVLAFLERFGTAHDVQRVIAIAETVYDEDVRMRAGRLALHLAWKKDRLDVLDRLRSVSGLHGWAIEQFALEPEGPHRAWALLRSDDYGARVAAANVVWDVVRPEVRGSLLTRYMRGQHFYNVVKAVDAKLYAPEWLNVG